MLDVACGPGAFVLAVAARVRFARGVDLTEALLRRGHESQREQGVLTAAFDRGEAERLPYGDGAFDLVSCQCSLHHMAKPEAALKEMLRLMKPEGRVMLADTLAPEDDAKFELHNRIERVRDPSHTRALRLTTFLEMFDRLELDVKRQAVRRRERSFTHWMLRAGLQPADRRYQEARRLLEQSIDGDRAGFSPWLHGDDITITHNEGMFLLVRRAG